MTIIFRTKKYIRTEAVGSNKLINLQGTDWSDIALYDHGDVRDILWKKWAGGDTLYRKKREEYARIELSIFTTDTPGDYFYEASQKESRHEFKKAIGHALENSAKHLGISCQQYTFDDYILTKEKLFKKEIKNSLFCVLCSYEDLSSLIPYFTGVSKMNDIVFIVTMHPFEAQKDTPLPFLGKVFTTDHSDTGDIGIQYIRKEIIKSGMDIVSIAGNENIIKKLNFFFKNRILYV